MDRVLGQGGRVGVDVDEMMTTMKGWGGIYSTWYGVHEVQPHSQETRGRP